MLMTKTIAGCGSNQAPRGCGGTKLPDHRATNSRLTHHNLHQHRCLCISPIFIQLNVAMASYTATGRLTVNVLGFPCLSDVMNSSFWVVRHLSSLRRTARPDDISILRSGILIIGPMLSRFIRSNVLESLLAFNSHALRDSTRTTHTQLDYSPS